MEGGLLCEEVHREAAVDLVQVEGGQGDPEAQVGQREGAVVLAYLQEDNNYLQLAILRKECIRNVGQGFPNHFLSQTTLT